MMNILGHPPIKETTMPLFNPTLPFGLDLNDVARDLSEIVHIGLKPEQRRRRLDRFQNPVTLFTDIWEHELHRPVYNHLWCLQEPGSISDLQAGCLRKDWFDPPGIKPDLSFLHGDQRVVLEIKGAASSVPSAVKGSMDHHATLIEGAFWILCVREHRTLERFWRSIGIPIGQRYASDPDILEGASCIAFLGFRKDTPE